MELSSLLNTSSSIESLIQQYMALEKQPVYTLEAQKSNLNIRSAMYSDLARYLESLKDNADDLTETDEDSIFNAIQVTSSDTESVIVNASDGAAVGTYKIRVRQLATPTSAKSTAELNTAPSTMSSNQVAAGSSIINTSESWDEAGFENTPDGTVTINGVTFTLADYNTVDAFIDAVNADETAEATIYYDDTRDKFFIESDDTSTNLVVSETPESFGFLTEINIDEGTYTTNNSGLQSDVYLYKANFDTEVAEDASGSFKINGVEIEWDADDDTLGDIISAINNSAAEVTAFYDDTLDKLMLTSNETGSEEIALEDVEGTFLTQSLKLSGASQTLGQDALFTINSTNEDDEITKTSNTFSINGISYSLEAITVENDSYSDAGTTAVTVSAKKDSGRVQAKLNSFLGAFNTLTSYIRTKSAVDTTTYSRGALAGQTIFTGLRNDLVKILADRVTGISDDGPTTLAEIGITFDSALTASISDASLLTEWLNDNPQAVEDLFNSENGIATRMAELLDPYTESYGIMEEQQELITEQKERIDTRIERLNTQLAQKEAYYRRQFTAMQQALNQIVEQQSLLSQFNNSLSSYISTGS